MREGESVMGVLKAIDEAVERHPERRFDVARALPPYRDPAVVGWFRDFEAWVEERTSTEAPIPLVEDALGDMAQGAPHVTPRQGDDRAGGPSALGSRRERVLVGLVAALPERFGPQAAEHPLVVDALQEVMPGRSREDAEERLRDLAGGPSVHSSYDSGLLLKPTGAGDADADPVPFFVTESEPLLGQLAGVEAMLDPLRWTDLAEAFWGPMTAPPAPSGHTGGRGPAEALVDEVRSCMREEFKVTDGFSLRPVLEFVRRPLQVPAPGRAGTDGARALEYRLCSGHDHGGVAHDAGVIVSRELGGQVMVTATKRVGFVGPFDGAALAMVADALGYQAAFEDMVRRALELTTPARTP